MIDLAMSSSGQVIAASVSDYYGPNTAFWSQDYGVSWFQSPTQVFVICTAVYLDYFLTVFFLQPPQEFHTIGMDSTGQYATFLTLAGEVYQTANYGTTWSSESEYYFVNVNFATYFNFCC